MIARAHPLWFAYILHRLSGLLLALFLPAHFYVLSLALNKAEALDSFLALTDQPLVKAAEVGLIFLLAVHTFGGLRLLALETLDWPAPQKSLAAGAVAVSLFVSGLFLMQAI
ncbi:MAG: succinate dehydrogenase [Pseudomonadota bacterium]